MTRYVIINADDFGLAPCVNRGIAEAYSAGGITSATMMVTMPGFDDAIRTTLALPGFGVGLHFNITEGVALSAPSSIASLAGSNGVFYPPQSPKKRELAEIALELRAQWNRFCATGLRPTHLDAHHHMHQVDAEVYEAMANLAALEKVPMRRAQSITIPARADTTTTDCIVLDSYSDADGLRRLTQHLTTLPDGVTELMCHPGHEDEALRLVSNWHGHREAELRVFADPAVAQLMQSLDIRAIHFGQLEQIEQERTANMSVSAPLSAKKLPFIRLATTVQKRVSKRLSPKTSKAAAMKRSRNPQSALRKHKPVRKKAKRPLIMKRSLKRMKGKR